MKSIGQTVFARMRFDAFLRMRFDASLRMRFDAVLRMRFDAFLRTLKSEVGTLPKRLTLRLTTSTFFFQKC